MGLGVENVNAAGLNRPTETLKKDVNARILSDEKVKRLYGQNAGDTFTKSRPEMSTEDKQEMIKKARAKAAGMSILFGPLSTVYYSLRSDKKVAKKFGLDAEADKDLIKNIKHQQTKAALPALFANRIGAIVSFICNKAKDPSKIDV